MSFIFCLITIFIAVFLLENNCFHFLVKIKRGWVNRSKETILCCRKYTTLLSPEGDDDLPKKSKITQEKIFVYVEEEDNKPFYTLFWNKCPECNELIKEMERRNLSFIFIDGIFDNSVVDFDEPWLYKNDELIDDIFAIYAEIFQM
jgi:hypothetical protein